MFDIFNLPHSSRGNIQTFTSVNSGVDGALASTGSAQIWYKPRNITMVYFLAVGGGGGGGGGASGTTAQSRGGGGGGGAPACGKNILPAIFLPDILYVEPGRGGVGGGAGIAGAAGIPSYVSLGIGGASA